MPSPDPERLAAAIMTAADQALGGGVRAVVASLSPALRRLLPADRFLVIRNAPHDWLFPRVRAIVHHGGAGTTGAAAAAGRPQVIWPFGVDQHFWADRMADLGVAPPARPVRALTGPTLAAVLDRALTDPRLAERAAGLGSRVRAEDGAGAAVFRLEQVGAIALWPLVKVLLAEDDTIMREFWRAKLSAMNPDWVTGTAESMADEPDRSAELTAAGVPSLVVHGKRDRRVWSVDAYADMARRLGAGHVIIPRASHSPNMEQPASVAAALLDFWGDTGTAGAREPATVAG